MAWTTCCVNCAGRAALDLNVQTGGEAFDGKMAQILLFTDVLSKSDFT